MRNVFESKISKLYSKVAGLPYFSLDTFASVEGNKGYLKVLLGRYVASGKVVRLKKGLYVSSEYITNVRERGAYSAYSEFIAAILRSPSYLSLEYVLYENNLLTDVPNNFTLVTKNKTINFSNCLGNFYYHSIRDDLFNGFNIVKVGDYSIYKATKAKALFDFLYFRKNLIDSKESFDELRLNLSLLAKEEKGELIKFVKIEGSRRLIWVLKNFF